MKQVLKEMETICGEVSCRYGGHCAVVHRTGLVRVGEPSVIVAASGSGHVAVEACAHLIDGIKARVPVWKLPHYANGGAEWAPGA